MFTKDTATKRIMLACVAAVVICATSQANAAYRDDRGRDGPEHMHFDDRFEHNHFYHERGYSVQGVPRGAYTIRYGGGAFRSSPSGTSTVMVHRPSARCAKPS